MKSFLSSTIEVWNSLQQSTRETDSLSSFKRILDKDKPIPNKLFFMEKEDCRLHLFWKNIVENPLCRCGETESNKHYFFVCKFYRNIRTAFRQCICEISEYNIDIVLFGDNNLSLAENEKIFDAVHTFIENSGRFA